MGRNAGRLQPLSFPRVLWSLECPSPLLPFSLFPLLSLRMSLLGAYRLHPQIPRPESYIQLVFYYSRLLCTYPVTPLFCAAQKRQLQTTRRRPILPRPKQSVPLFSLELFLSCIGLPIHASQLTSSNHCSYCCAFIFLSAYRKFPHLFLYSQLYLSRASRLIPGIPCRSGQLKCSNLLHIHFQHSIPSSRLTQLRTTETENRGIAPVHITHRSFYRAVQPS
ncbi:hypothetical protein BDW69DRAFT_128851 [Aspergillus filifer]